MSPAGARLTRHISAAWQRRGVVVAIGALALALGSCQRDQLRDILGELQQAQHQASERAGTSEVAVNLNHRRFLTIGIANSPWQSLPTDEREQKALEIAKLAYASLAPKVRLEVVTVSFAIRRTYFQFFKYSKATDAFQFEIDDLSPRSAERVSERSVPMEKPQADLYLVAVGDVPADLLNDLTTHFEGKFGIPFEVLSSLLFDRATFDRQRSQTIADELISAVRRRYPRLARDSRARVIAVTPHDMYMREMANQWQFTFSLRSDDDHFAVVSYARMDPARLGGRADAERLKTRLRKMVAKNIGIMYYGLPISQDPRSVLYGQIGGLRELDEMTEQFEPVQKP
jgi:predicted Zn-dependent protease